MKTNKNNLLLAALVLSALLAAPARCAETISHVTLRTGAVRFQIQNALSGQAYRLQLEDLKGGQTPVPVAGFAPGPLPGTLLAQADLKKQGVYRIRLFRGAQEVDLHQEDIQVPDIMNAENAKIDRLTSTITWHTPRSSLARVNAILINGMRIDIIAPWHFTSNQEQSAKWDFNDRIKVKNYRDHPNLQVYVQFVPLPDYLVVVGRPPFAEYQQCPLFQHLPLPSGDNEITLEPLARELRSVPQVPNNQIPVVRAGTAFRVRLDPQTKKRMGNNRYEIMFYADGEFIHEESEGVDPYTFLLPRLPRASGLIYFSANLADYRGNTGTHTIAAWYEAEP